MDNEKNGDPGICLNEEDDGSDEADWSDVDDEQSQNREQIDGENQEEEEEGDEDDNSDESNESGSENGEDEEGSGSDGGGSSDDSDGMSEKCAICLQRFSGQEIGSPETCEHHFCLKCITEWSKKVATCPVDRKTFPAILVKEILFGPVLRIVDVEVGAGAEQASYEEYDTDPTYCEICGHCDREDRLLLCDGCDLGYHLECLEPPMEYIPIEDWYCTTCQVQRLPPQPAQATEEEAGPSQTTNTRPSRRELRLPRTGLGRRIVESLSRQINYRETTSSVENSRPNKRTTTRRKTKTSTRKTKRKRGKRKTSTKGTRGKKKRLKKGRSRVAIQRRPATARARIAHQLGIVPPRRGQVYVGLPRCRAQSSQAVQASNTSSLHNLRYQAGITPLRIYSTSEDLADYIETYSDEEIGSVEAGSSGGGVVIRAAPVHRIGIPAKTLAAIPTPRSRVTGFLTTQQSSSPDILGPILNNQIIMLTDRNIQIKRDGTLVPSITPSSNQPTSPPGSSRQANSPTAKFPSSTPHSSSNNNNNNNNVPYPGNSRISLQHGNNRANGIRQVPITPNSNESATTTTTAGTSSHHTNNNSNNNNVSNNNSSSSSSSSSVAATNANAGNSSSSSELMGGNNNNTQSENNNFGWNSTSNSVGQNVHSNYDDPKGNNNNNNNSSKPHEPYLYNNNNKSPTKRNNKNDTTTNTQNEKEGEAKAGSAGNNNDKDDDDEEYNIYSDIEEDAVDDTDFPEKDDHNSSRTPINDPDIEEEEEGSERNLKERDKDRDSDSDMVIDEYRVGVIAGSERESRSSVESSSRPLSTDLQQNKDQDRYNKKAVSNANESNLTINDSFNSSVHNQTLDTSDSLLIPSIPSPTSIPLPDSTPPYDIDEDDDYESGDDKVCDIIISSPSSPDSDSESEDDSFKNDAAGKNRAKEEYDPSQPLTSSDEEEHSIKLLQKSSPNTIKKLKKLSKIPLPKSPAPPPKIIETASKQPTPSQQQRKQEPSPSKQQQQQKQQDSSPSKQQKQESPTKQKQVAVPKNAASNLSSSESEGNVDLNSIPMPSEDFRPTIRPTIQFSIPSRHRLLPISSLIKRQKGVMRKENKSGNTLSFSSEISKAFGEEKGEDSDDDNNQGEGHEHRVSLVAEIFGSDDDEEEQAQQQAVLDNSKSSNSNSSSNTTAATSNATEILDKLQNTNSGSLTDLTTSGISSGAVVENILSAQQVGHEQIQSQPSFSIGVGSIVDSRWKTVSETTELVSTMVTNSSATPTTPPHSPPPPATLNDAIINSDNTEKSLLNQRNHEGETAEKQQEGYPDVAGGDESDDSIAVLETIKVSTRKENRRPLPPPHHRNRPLHNSQDDDIILLKEFSSPGASQQQPKDRNARESRHVRGSAVREKEKSSSTSAAVVPSSANERNRRPRSRGRTGDKAHMLESISEEDSETYGGSERDLSPSSRFRKRNSRRDREERDKDRDKDKEKDREKDREKDKAKQKEREVLKDKSSKITNLTSSSSSSSKRKRSLTPLSNCEEGEIVDSPEKRRKRRKEKKKSKKRKRSKDSKSSRLDFSEKKVPDTPVPGLALSDADNNDNNNRGGENLVSWRKPSSSTKERNYRDGKPKPEERYFKSRDKKQDQSPHDRREKHVRDKTPPSTPRDKSKGSKNESKRSTRRRSISPFAGRRSFSKSPKSRSRSFSRSRFRNRSTSSNKSFRSRSRSRSLRRKYRRLSSLSPRRTRSISKSPQRLRSRSPTRKHGRKKSSSNSRSTRRPRQRSLSGSSSDSIKRDRRKKKDKEKVSLSDKGKKRKEKEKEKTHEARTPTETKEQEKEKDKKKRKRRREKSVSPAKAIFADGDSIVVSLNFQNKGNTNSSSTTTTNTNVNNSPRTNNSNNNNNKDGNGGSYTPPPIRNDSETSDKVKKKSKNKHHGKSGEKDENRKPRLLKKTLLIDLETSPIQEQNIGVSPTLIVLSDDEDGNNNGGSGHGGDGQLSSGKGIGESDGISKEIHNKDGSVGVNVTTSYDDGPNGDSSPYRHGVPADSTHPPHQNDSSKNDDSTFNTSSPYESGNLSPATRGGDSLVTSTRDTEIGLAHHQDEMSRSPSSPPTTPPPPLPNTASNSSSSNNINQNEKSSSSSSEMLHPHPRSPPPPRGVSPPPPLPNSPYMMGGGSDTSRTNNNIITNDDKNLSTSGTPSSSSSSNIPTHNIPNGQGLSSIPALTGKPLGIGNIPGLFPSSISSNTTGSMNLPPPPIVIPTPPNPPQMRFPSSVGQSILTPNVLASVAALYGPLMAARNIQQQQQQQQQQSAMNMMGNKFSNSSQMGNVIGSKQQGSVLLPKNQNSHSHGSRSKSGAGGDSPFSPNSSDGDDLFEPPLDTSGKGDKLGNSQVSTNAPLNTGNAGAKPRDKNSLFDNLFGAPAKKGPATTGHHKSHDKSKSKSSHHKSKSKRGAKKEIVKLSEGELRLTEDVPTSAVELRVKEKFLKKLNRQERVVEEVKLSLKPHYSKKHVTKDEYKEILRRAVPKICHNKTGEINPFKIKELVEAYVKKFRHARKKE